MDIGIDLGTTFSVIAVNGRVDLAADHPPGIYLAECDVTVIPTPYGEPTFPSVSMFDPDDTSRQLFAADAVQRAEEGHAPIMFSKRKIGTREQIPTAARPVLAREVARDFLRYLKGCAEQALGRPVVRAVVTHPAYFDRSQVEETRAAAREAGFDMGLPEQMLMEPLAAAYTYVRTDPRDPLRVLTYDLGGGTFDVTYLERSQGVIAMRSFDGDPLLGGYNFDRELVHWVRQKVEARGRKCAFDEDDPADRGRLARLLRIAEEVKIKLARADKDTDAVPFRVRGGVLLDDKGKDVSVDERITRAEFVGLIAPYLDRTIAACQRALAKAKVSPADVDEVLLVGGSTYGPWVAERVRAAFPTLAPKLFQPDLCVGAGAAIAARLTLPPLVSAGECRLVLDVPEKVAVPTLTVAGRLTGAGAGPFRAALTLPTGELSEPVELRPDGGFLFDTVELADDAPNRFTITVTGPGGAPVLAHPFEVVYAPETAEATAVTIVLPKPLSIETFGGLALLADEGTPLPARCEQTFTRLNDNPNMPLRLFQGAEPIGEVRVHNIPKEGGRGSFVDLRLEITEKNQVRGTAQVRTPAGAVVARADVSIHFDTPEVPPAGALIDQFEALKHRFVFALDRDPDRAPELEVAAAPLIREVERGFEQQPLERHEIHVALRKLAELLTPPKDEMQPPRREFEQLVAECRAGVERLRDTPDSPDAARKAAAFPPVIDRLETEGRAAHAARDRKAWAAVCDALGHIEYQTRPPRGKAETPPTPICKLLADMELMRERGRLQHEVRKLAADDRLGDWAAEVQRIGAGLVLVQEKVFAVDDALPGEQGRAQIQLIFSRELAPLRDAIARLGKDIARA